MSISGRTETTVYRCARLATMAEADGGYGLIEDAAVAVDGDTIAWAGTAADLPEAYRDIAPVDFGERLITPGLIDCHTHLVFAGNRATEFERRLNGESYEEIARSGGGIMASVRATRAASVDDLVASATPRLQNLIAGGVTTVEIKSGYGLTIASELTMLRAARRLGEIFPIDVKTTFLGAHAVPPEFAGQPDAYLDAVCLPALQAAHAEGLVDAVDGFCEGIAFSPGEIARVFAAATALGLPVKLHAEQLSNRGGARLAARHGALSADHLEHASDGDAAALAEAGTVAVLLPGAFYALRESQRPPVDAFRRHGVAMAVATDGNPGTSPLFSVVQAMNMACTLFGLTPAEALAGVTRNAARALGLGDRGAIAPGKRADLAVWNVSGPAELAYYMGLDLLHQRIFGGGR